MFSTSISSGIGHFAPVHLRPDLNWKPMEEPKACKPVPYQLVYEAFKTATWSTKGLDSKTKQAKDTGGACLTCSGNSLHSFWG